MKSHAALAVGFIALLTSRAAFADDPTKQQCVDADTQAQSLRTEGKLSATREQLNICANAVCPAVVRDDCAQRIDEINRVQPTVVFTAKSGAGRDLVDVKVSMDGQPLTIKLDGRPLAVDPGDHAFVFEVLGETAVTQHFVLAESEKNRREAITIGRVPAVPTTDRNSPNEPGANTSDPNAGKTQRIMGIAVAGVGVAGVAVGAIFGLSASSSWSNAKSECATTDNCTNRSQADSDRSSALTSSTISTIGFIAGGALVVGGAVLFFTAPKHKEITVGLSPTPGGAMLRGTF